MAVDVIVVPGVIVGGLLTNALCMCEGIFPAAIHGPMQLVTKEERRHRTVGYDLTITIELQGVLELVAGFGPRVMHSPQV